MQYPNRPAAIPQQVREMAAKARLALSAERAQALCPVVDQVFASYDSLDQVPLGDTPPASAFKCRWTDAPA